MKWQEFVPPILMSFGRKMQQHLIAEQFYSSYADALSACHGGYEETQLIRTVYEKTRIYRGSLVSQSLRVFDLSSLRTLVGLSLAGRDRDLNVLDVGGACGVHYLVVF